MAENTAALERIAAALEGILEEEKKKTMFQQMIATSNQGICDCSVNSAMHSQALMEDVCQHQ